jgi:leucyl-tRNA synthetase
MDAAEHRVHEGADEGDGWSLGLGQRRQDVVCTFSKADAGLQEIRTCDPDFYKHTQRIFLMLHERGLAYQAESLVNYDPVDKTVLANEQVDANGCSWRSGAKVEKVMLKQWFLKITQFQDALLDDLQLLEKDGAWPENVLAMQRNWIGKSEGTKLRFDIEAETGTEQFDPVDVFTTRADTLFGVQYIALSLTHPIVQRQAVEDASLRAFIEKAKDLPPDSKDGYLLANIKGRNPIAEQIAGVDPLVAVYVAPYVLGNYGSGAVMGVPGHDTRDHAFWRANAGSDPIKVVVVEEPNTTPSSLVPGTEDDPTTKTGYVAAHIDRFGGLASTDAIHEIVAALREGGKHAEPTTHWRLRDWLVSRQRYWGAPIPIVHCPSCGSVPVPEEDLPVKLPDLPDTFFSGKRGNPLAEDEHWKQTKCPNCGSAAVRETDTMDTFMDSSWYFFRFLDSRNEATLVSSQKADKGMPVDLYVGGVEHAILHLLYARFISKFLASTSIWPQGGLVNGEPFKRLITQGMVHGETFTDPENGRFLRPDELDLTSPSKPLIKANGIAPNVSYEKMSKSKYNGVDPGATIAAYGADATRAHILFQAPVGDVLEWDPKKIAGVQRWLGRVARLSSASWIPDQELARFEIPENPDLKLLDILKWLAQKEILLLPKRLQEYTPEKLEVQLIALLTPLEKRLWEKTQETIAAVKESYSQTYALNTVVSHLMTLTNAVYDTLHQSSATPYIRWYCTVHLVRMVAPIAPGVAEEAWQMLTARSTAGDEKSENHDSDNRSLRTVFAAGFPVADLDVIPRLSRTATCLVQVDGKRKFEFQLEKLPEGENIPQWVLTHLLQEEEGKRWLDRDTGKAWELSNTKQPHPEHQLIPDDWEMILANRHRICNLVSPQKAAEKKSKRGSHPQAVAVSLRVSEERVRIGLNPDSNEKITSASNTVSRGLSDSDDLPLEITVKQPLSRSALLKLHDRIDKHMASLPTFLRPHYAPPSILPVSQKAITLLLHSVGLTPSSISGASIANYTTLLANLPTPRTIAPAHVLTALGPGDRANTIFAHNVVFADQIALPAAPKLAYPQRSCIARKLRRYREWANAMIQDQQNPERGLRVARLEMPGFKDAYGGNVRHWGRSDTNREIERVGKVWQDIVALWARGVERRIEVTTPSEQVIKEGEGALGAGGNGQKHDQDVSRREDEDVDVNESGQWSWLTDDVDLGPNADEEDVVGDWVDLAGEDPNVNQTQSSTRAKRVVPRWG